MTIEQLFDEYAYCASMPNPITQRMAEIIKEIEANIRREVVEDILFKIPARYSKYRGFALDEGEQAHNSLINRIENIIKEYALSKGITLK